MDSNSKISDHYWLVRMVFAQTNTNGDFQNICDNAGSKWYWLPHIWMFMLDNDLNDLDNAGWPKGYLCSIISIIRALHDRISAWSNVDAEQCSWCSWYWWKIILTIQALHDRISAWSNVDAEQGRQQVEACRERCRELQGDAEICFVFA